MVSTKCRLQIKYKMQTWYKMQTADRDEMQTEDCRLTKKTLFFFLVRNVVKLDFISYLLSCSNLTMPILPKVCFIQRSRAQSLKTL